MPAADCKGCRATVQVSAQEIEELFGGLKARNVRCVSEATHSARLDVCGRCDALEYGTTCRFCGCLVKVRAKLLVSDCPDPSGSKWG